MIHRQTCGAPTGVAVLPRPRSWRVGAAIVSVLVLAFIGGSLIRATTTLGGAFPGSNGKIAYASYQGGNIDVYVRNSDGSGEMRLTTDTDIDTQPAVSADGSKVVYASKQGGGAFEIYSMSIDGSDKTNLSNHVNEDYEPTWSPDGTKVAFTSDRSGSIDVWVMNADGTGAENLTSGVVAEDREPTWSPDGTKIAFASKRAGNYDVWVMDADGTDPVNLTGSASAEDQWPTWSPDGTQVAFASKRAGNLDVWIMDADGSAPLNLTSDTAAEDQEPSWSPDGTKIAFASKRSGNFDVWVMNADGSSPVNYTSGNSQEDYTPDWGGLPAAPVFSTTSPPSPANDNAPEILGTAPAGSTVTLYTDAACSSAVAATGSAAEFASPGLTVSVADDTTTTYYATATNAGGTSPCSLSSITYTEDSTPPDTTITGGPSGLTSDSTPTFSFESGDPGATFECRVDAGAWAVCSSPHTVGPLADGPHTFEVRAVDAADNADPTPASVTITVDTEAPDTSITAGPSGVTADSTPTWSFESGDPDATFECRVDGGAWVACTSPHTVGPLADGSHTLEVRAVDEAGNADSTPASVTVTVDTLAPESTITDGPSGATGDSTPTFSFESSEPGSTFECRVDGGAWVACTSPYTVGPLADGSHVFEVRAVDAAGNPDQTPASVTITVDTTEPGGGGPGGSQSGGGQTGGSQQGGSQQGGQTQRPLDPALEDLGTISGNLAAAGRCQRLSRPVRSRSVFVPRVGTVHVGMRSSPFVTTARPALVTVRGPSALRTVRYLLNARSVRGAARAPFRLALGPAALSTTSRNVLTIRLAPERGKAKRVKLRLNTTPCRTVFVAAQRSRTSGSRLTLRVDSVRALNRITFKVPSRLLPKRAANEAVGRLTLRTANGGRNTYRLAFRGNSGRALLTAPGAPRVLLRRGQIDVSRLPANTGIVGLALKNQVSLTGRVKLRARVVGAEGVDALSVALGPRRG